MTAPASVGRRVCRTDAGVRIVVNESRAAQVAVAFVVGAGSRADPAGKVGLAHLVEHCTYRSDGSRTHSAALTAAGSLFGASTYPDTTEFYLVTRSQSLAHVLSAEAQRLRAPTLDADTLVRERNAIEEERAARAASRAADDLWVRHLRRHGPTTAAWHDGYGDPASLAALDHEDVLLFHRAHYRAENLVVAIETPDVDVAMTEALAAFDGVEGGLPLRHAESETASDPTWEVATAASGAVASLAVRLNAVEDLRGYAAHLVLSAVLAPSGVSLAVGRHGPLTTSAPDLALVAAVDGDPDRAGERLRVVLEAAAAASHESVEVGRVRARIDFALVRDAPLVRARTLARTLWLWDDPDLALRLSSSLMSVTDDDVRAAAGRLRRAMP